MSEEGFHPGRASGPHGVESASIREPLGEAEDVNGHGETAAQRIAIRPIALTPFERRTNRNLSERLGLPLPDLRRAEEILAHLEVRAQGEGETGHHLAADEKRAWRRYLSSRRMVFWSGVAIIIFLAVEVFSFFAGLLFVQPPGWLLVVNFLSGAGIWLSVAAGLVTLILARRLRFVMYLVRAGQNLAELRRWGSDTSGSIVDYISRASIVLFNLATMKWFSPMVPPVLQNRAARQAYAVLSPLYVPDLTGIYAQGESGAAQRSYYSTYLDDISALVAVGRSDLISLYSSVTVGLKGAVPSSGEFEVSEEMMDYFIPVKGSRGITFVKEGIVPFASLLSVTIAVVALILSRMGH